MFFEKEMVQAFIAKMIMKGYHVKVLNLPLRVQASDYGFKYVIQTYLI